MRGEHIERKTREWTKKGPSPHARGARRRGYGVEELDGTIPACAGSTTGSWRPLKREGDHPRMRGEHVHQRVTGGGYQGPSPHARGAHHSRIRAKTRSGTIPACAGSTRGSPPLVTFLAGPSPHARGAQEAVGRPRCGAGTIPACAGSTLRRRPESRPRRDHPRMRGEHRPPGEAGQDSRGPSPHARGALVRAAGRPHRGGTIPACAGSTRSSWPTPMWSGDHPRMRGEHKKQLADPDVERGPSPHARGAQEAVGRPRCGAGTIPACAGSTRSSWPTPMWSGDHPRMRGEHKKQLADPDVERGPSPHARGAQEAVGRPRCGAGTIPACAGSTAPRGKRVRIRGDHPRMRGEHGRLGRAGRGCRGPSPHARGALISQVDAQLAVGTIPACAGSTHIPGRRTTGCGDHPRMRGEHSYPR